MLKKPITRILIVAFLVGILTLRVATPALAFDWRDGKTVTIPASEVVNDDLYVGAENAVIIDGTIKGDLIVASKTIVINGTVEGDLIAAAQDITINGTIKDDVRMAGAALLIGEKASIGSDVIAAGASLEMRKGSSIGEDLIFAGGQALLAGDIGRNLKSTTGSLELRGNIGGDAAVDVGSSETDITIPESSITTPHLSAGMTIAPSTKISGKLDYTSSKEMTIPAGTVVGKVTHSEPKVSRNVTPKAAPTMVEIVLKGVLDVLRNIASLILVGLLLLWLFPSFIKTTTERVKTAPLPSLGWGIIYIAAFFFSLLIIVITMIVGGIVFGILSLGGLSGTIIFVGLLLLFAIILGFCISVGFVAQIIVSILGGQLILSKVNPQLAENKYLPLIIGVLIYAILAAIPGLGVLIGIVTVLIGLGAVWYFGQGLFTKRPVAIA